MVVPMKPIISPASPVTLAALDLASPTTPPWMTSAIAEAAGRLGVPRAWYWLAGDDVGTVLHFSIGGQGNREYAIGIQCGDAAASWAETCFAGVPSGITAAIERHFCADV